MQEFRDCPRNCKRENIATYCHCPTGWEGGFETALESGDLPLIASTIIFEGKDLWIIDKDMDIE